MADPVLADRDAFGGVCGAEQLQKLAAELRIAHPAPKTVPRSG